VRIEPFEAHFVVIGGFSPWACLCFVDVYADDTGFFKTERFGQRSRYPHCSTIPVDERLRLGDLTGAARIARLRARRAAPSSRNETARRHRPDVLGLLVASGGKANRVGKFEAPSP